MWFIPVVFSTALSLSPVSDVNCSALEWWQEQVSIQRLKESRANFAGVEYVHTGPQWLQPIGCPLLDRVEWVFFGQAPDSYTDYDESQTVQILKAFRYLKVIVLQHHSSSSTLTVSGSPDGLDGRLPGVGVMNISD